MLLNDAISPAKSNSSDDKSADSSCVKPIPCATEPKTEISCCASDDVKPNKLAFLLSWLLSFSEALPKVVPKAQQSAK